MTTTEGAPVNITEADKVCRLLRLLDGSTAGRNVDQIIEAAESLAERAAKPLQITVRLDRETLRRNVVDLLLAAADPEQVDA